MKRLIIKTPEDLEKTLGSVKSTVSIDTETTSLNVLDMDMLGFSLCDGEIAFYCPITSRNVAFPKVQRILNEFLPTRDLVCFHNATFDLKVLHKFLDCSYRYTPFCTLIGYALCNENDNQRGLKDLALKILKIDPNRIRSFEKASEKGFDHPDFHKYAIYDAEWCYQLFRWEESRLKKEKCWHVARNIESPFLWCLMQLEYYGIKVDRENIERLREESEEKIFVLERKLLSFLNKEHEEATINGETIYKSPINFNSTKQLASVIQEDLGITIHTKTKTKAPSTSKDSLEKMAGHPFIDTLLEYKQHQTMLSKFLKPIPEYIQNNDRVYTSYNIVTTGRLSCIAEGELVQTVGGEKKIEDVLVGDLVYCYNKDKKLTISKVTASEYKGVKDCVDVKWRSSGTGRIGHLLCTPDHNILHKYNDWVRADSLKRGDKLCHMTKSKQKSEIEHNHEVLKVTNIGPRKIYDLEIEEHNNFIASEICVHNSSKPPLQQLKKNREEGDINYRSLFIEEEGFDIIKADYSGQELCVLAAVTQDKVMLDAINNGEDLHLKTANRIFGLGIADKDLRKDSKNYPDLKDQYELERYHAKNGANFPIIYGTTYVGIAGRMKIEKKEAKRWIEEFFDLYPAVKERFDSIEKQLLNQGYVTTLFGRRRRFPYFSKAYDSWKFERNKRAKFSKRFEVDRQIRQAFNHAVQGSSADMLKIAGGKVAKAATKYGARCILTVHDELVVGCPKKYSEIFAKEMKRIMCNCIKLPVQISVDLRLVSRYGD